VALILLLYKRFFLSVVAFLFTALITPTPLSLPVTKRLLHADEQHLLSLLSADRLATIWIALLVLLIAWRHSNNVVEALGMVAAIVVVLGVLIVPHVALSLPVPLHLASLDEQHTLSWLCGNLMLAIPVGLVILIGLSTSSDNPGRVLVGIIAVVGAVALVPYIYNIYPVPRETGYYYATVLHNPWLPAERIALRSGVAYYGYVLSTGDGWFTVLLVNRRTIIYIPAANVVSRAVCQPQLQDQPKPYPPLITLFYSAPPHIPACPDRDVVAIEVANDWNSPTSVGQHF
jgi:hypothetical protein